MRGPARAPRSTSSTAAARFRYEFDVAYALLGQRRGRSIDEIQGEIDAEYAQTERRHEPVYPPS